MRNIYVDNGSYFFRVMYALCSLHLLVSDSEKLRTLLLTNRQLTISIVYLFHLFH